MIAMRKRSPSAAGRFYVIIPGRSTAPAFLSRGLLTRAGLRLAPAQVLAQRRGPAGLLLRLVFVGLFARLGIVRHAKRLRHFRPCGKDRAIRGAISQASRTMLP
jgi:hypothetical protein